jgi:hypothetical protein
MTRTLRQFAAAAFVALSGFGVAASVRAETIASTAVLHYRTGGVERELTSNTVALQTTPERHPVDRQVPPPGLRRRGGGPAGERRDVPTGVGVIPACSGRR